MKLTLKGYILVPDADLAAIRMELPNHIQLSRAEPGCLLFDVTPDQDNPNRFNVYEEFVDKEAFEYHQQRVRNSKWGEVSHNAERHYQLHEK